MCLGFLTFRFILNIEPAWSQSDTLLVENSEGSDKTANLGSSLIKLHIHYSFKKKNIYMYVVKKCLCSLAYLLL